MPGKHHILLKKADERTHLLIKTLFSELQSF